MCNNGLKHHDRQNQYKLRNCLGLPPHAGGNHLIFSHGQKPHACYNQFPRQNDHDHPGGNIGHIFGDKRDQRRHDQHFIRKRVHQLAKRGDLIIFSGQMPVQLIRQRGQKKREDRQIQPERAAGQI